jgi:hypothetical protein
VEKGSTTLERGGPITLINESVERAFAGEFRLLAISWLAKT